MSKMLVIVILSGFACASGCDSGSMNDFSYEVRQVGNSMVYQNTSGKDLTGLTFYADGQSVKRSRFSAGSTETIGFVTFGIRPGTEVQSTMIICDQGRSVRNR